MKNSSDDYYLPPLVIEAERCEEREQHYHECLPDREYLQPPHPHHIQFQASSPKEHSQQSVLSPYLEYFIDDRDGYYDHEFDDDDSGPAEISKREKLERLFDGHKIRTPFDTFTFLLRFLLFILILTKYTLITTLVIQGRLYEYVNHESVSPTKLTLFTITYFALTMIFLVMLPVPDNKCRCHFFIVMSLTAFSSIELLFNSSNPILKLTQDLNIATLSVTILSLSYFICLWFKLILYMLRKSIRAVKRSPPTKSQSLPDDLNML